jgi:hypothetical protein
MRVIDRDLIRGEHYGQRPRVPHTQAEHMGAPTNAANVKKVLANSEPSTHGGKADIGTATELLGSAALTVDLHQSFQRLAEWKITGCDL